MNQVPAIPDSVRRAFSLPSDKPVRLGSAWNNGWKVGSYVLSPAVHPQYSSRIASFRASLQVPGLQIARPIRASDGRYIFSGWQATYYCPGTLSRRADEHVAVALRLEAALQGIPASRVFQTTVQKQSRCSAAHAVSTLISAEGTCTCEDLWNLFVCADAVAWSDSTDSCQKPPVSGASGEQVRDGVSPEPAYELAQHLINAANSRPCDVGKNYLCHGDLVHSLISEGSHQPTLTDFFPLLRPLGYSAALAIVDNLIAENAGLGLLHRYRCIPNIETLCLRAGAYRLLVHSALQIRGLTQNSNIISNVQKLL